MKPALKSSISAENNVLCGLFSKKEGAQFISKGLRHLHSTSLGARDACAQITRKRVLQGKNLPYPWEQVSGFVTFSLSSSDQRYELISRLVSDPLLKSKRELTERARIVLEELITNSVYHAYIATTGEEKYNRKKPVRLTGPSETISVRYAVTREGVFLEVKDRGGRLVFDQISRSLDRCYGSTENQIENKESGAGLGLYMVFEAVTHLKIECHYGQGTVFSCWISDKRSTGTGTFSFNYFGKG